jgi:hypothetical protein
MGHYVKQTELPEGNFPQRLTINFGRVEFLSVDKAPVLLYLLIVSDDLIFRLVQKFT